MSASLVCCRRSLPAPASRLEISFRIFNSNPDFKSGRSRIKCWADESHFGGYRLIHSCYFYFRCRTYLQSLRLSLRQVQFCEESRGIHYGYERSAGGGSFSRIERPLRHHSIDRRTDFGITQLCFGSKVFPSAESSCPFADCNAAAWLTDCSDCR